MTTDDKRRLFATIDMGRKELRIRLALAGLPANTRLGEPRAAEIQAKILEDFKYKSRSLVVVEDRLEDA